MNIEINSDFIKLGQLLKMSGVSESGAMAKVMIQDGIVSYNGQVNTQRGKKVYPGDKVSIDLDELIEITVERAKG